MAAAIRITARTWGSAGVGMVHAAVGLVFCRWAAMPTADEPAPLSARSATARESQIGSSLVVSTGSHLFHPRLEICL
jgi:hypothetical protein